MSKQFKDLTIKDAFMFAAVMSDPEECRRLLQLILDMDILEVQVITEKTMAYHPEYHGIRLDVLAEEQGTKRRFNIEMQVKSQKDLPRRSRYYHSQLDMDALVSGKRYRELPDTYVIFICDFALSSEPLYKYTYTSVCQENNSVLDEGRTTIFLSTRGENDKDVSKELVSFLNYVKGPEGLSEENWEDPYVASLEAKIQSIKHNREMEARYMMLEEMLKDEREAGRQEGEKAGRIEGEKAGRIAGEKAGSQKVREQLNILARKLSQQGRLEDVIRATEDEAYFKELCREVGLED